MSFIKHSPFFLNDITVPPSWTQQVELLGQSHLLRENGHAAQISIDVPHLSEEEISVELRGNRIVVSGDNHQPDHEEKFERHFVVDDIVDASQIKANLHEGVLFLTIQRQPKAASQRIPIVRGCPDQIVVQGEEQESWYA
jgi:hypothetical protein